jgi:glycosyltransferase involved in cell wall biosynthesis
MYSIIIPTFRTEEELSEMIKEVKESVTGVCELIVTSTEASAAVNRNIGLNKAKYDNIIMIDDDMRDFPVGWNEEIIRPLNEEERVVLVSARLINKDGSAAMNMGGNYDVSKPIVEVLNGFIPTACIAYKKNELRFDENYIGSGFEDTDLMCQFMRKFPEGRHVINNSVMIVHLNEMKRQRDGRWEKNESYYRDKWKDFTGRKPFLVLVDKKISLCMIVKDEEKNLVRCLESVKDKVDEIVIVDTGSVDSTKEIAAKYGAKILDYEWDNDFGKARNVGIEAATGDWILVLDADEELLGSKEELQQMVNVPVRKPVSYLLRIENVMDGGAQVEHHMARLFTHADHIVFEGPIHEHVKSTRDNLISVVCDKIKIRHYGYGSKVVNDKNKTFRNIESLLAELEKNPDSAFFRYHLGVTYRVKGENDKAIEQFELWHKLILELKEQVDVSMGYAAYLGSLLTAGRHAEGKVIGDLVQRKCLHNPDFCLNYAIVLENLGNLDLAQEFVNKAMGAKNNKFPALSFDRDSMGWKALAVLGNIYAQKGDYVKAVATWEQGLKEVPTNKDILKALITAYTNSQDLRKAEDYMTRLFKAHPDEKTEQAMLILGNIYFNTSRIEEALEIFWNLPNRKTYMDQLLSGLISYQQYSQIKIVDNFIKTKEDEMGAANG